MKKILIFLMLTALVAAWAFDTWAQGKSKGDNLFYVFSEKTVKIDKKKVRYRAVLTAPTDTARPAIIIYLHGGSGTGSDNEQQLRSPGIAQIYDYLAEQGIKAYFLVPQCEDESSWSGPHPRRSPSPRARQMPVLQPVCQSIDRPVCAGLRRRPQQDLHLWSIDGRRWRVAHRERLS